MKKLLLSLLVLTSMSAFAQRDISVTLNTPAIGDTIRKGMPFNITYTVKNESTAAFTNADTIIVLFTLGGQAISGTNGPIGQLIATDIAPGASINGALNGLALNFNQAGNTNLCVVAYIEEDSVNDANNVDCAAISLAFNTGLSELEKAASTVNVYPNPSSDVVNFTIDYSKASTVRITDITGREVEVANFNMNQAAIDVHNYNGGVYLYQIMNTEGQVVKTGKLTVNN